MTNIYLERHNERKIKFQIGDIIEIALPKEHIYAKWNGLTIEVSDFYTNHVSGKVLKECNPDQGYPIGSHIAWCIPETFTHVTAAIKETLKEEKYLSPFSGHWT
jgi:hypothetical protein